MENLKKDIKINKILLINLIIIAVVAGLLCTSFALFSGTTKPKQVVTLKSGNELPLLEQINKSIEKAKMNSTKLIIEEDGIKYFSGTNEQIDFNYVWYSGKLWRIISVYPDGRMKMLANDHIALSTFGKDTTFENSWAYQWLNEDFLETLENYDKVIDIEAEWNNTIAATSTTIPENTTMVKAPVGMITAYEFYKSYQSVTNTTGYLSTTGWLWTLTPKNATTMYGVNTDSAFADVAVSSNAELKPAVYLKANLHILTGDGSKENPYVIKEAEAKEVTNGTTKLNSRVSGEFVKFNGLTWRIVNTEYNTESGEEDKQLGKVTKLINIDFIRDNSGAILTKRFSNNITYGQTTTDTYWDYYLNNTWFNVISNDYRKMIIKSTYYQGVYNNQSYKASVCATADDNVTVMDCKKTTSRWTGYVGLPRVGEMFASQYDYAMKNIFWLITPYTTANATYATAMSLAGVAANGTTAYAARPTITLKSDVVITDGTGTELNPFEIKCDTCSLT